MQQMYRCWSWWMANPDKNPVLIFRHRKDTMNNEFFVTFLDVLQAEISLVVVPNDDGPYVQAKDTGMWENDVEFTDYAILDPDRKLRDVFAPYLPSTRSTVQDPPCSRKDDSVARLPKIAILNVAEESSRHIWNAKELAASIEDTFPGQIVPMVYSENHTLLEHVQFFMENDIVLSPHGAHLTGIAFMKNCSTIVEFFPKDFLLADMYRPLAANVGVTHKYFYLSDNEDQIQSFERFHYVPTAEHQEIHQCPNVTTVMSALFDVIRNWRPCCSAKSYVPTTKSERYIRPTPKRIINHSTSNREEEQQPTIDILAVGSLSRIDYLNTQQRTFGSHHLVRHYYPITELNDTDKHCYTDLTSDQYEKVISFCRIFHDPRSNLKHHFYANVFRPSSNAVGWLCAQKRPIDAFRLILEKYKSRASSIPDYLYLVDDDTYLNMDALVPTFQASYPPDENHLVAGCTYHGKTDAHFIFPVGGMGSMYTRATIEQILKPIHCQDVAITQDPFIKWACWRLNQNNVGEASFFEDGMSVGDLMISYTSGLPFTKVDEWDQVGYCFHSDHTIAYFFNYYHVSVPEWLLNVTNPTDAIRIHYSYKKIVSNYERGHSGQGGECDNLHEKCTPESRICHYVGTEQMRMIYNQQESTN